MQIEVTEVERVELLTVLMAKYQVLQKLLTKLSPPKPAPPAAAEEPPK